jgi:hypothetical protein
LLLFKLAQCVSRDLALLISRCREATELSLEEADGWWTRHERRQTSGGTPAPISNSPTSAAGRDITIDLSAKRR